MNDEYNILKDQVNHDYFKEVYIKCKKALNYMQDTIATAPNGDL